MAGIVYGWDEAVEDLASRGFTLKALLDFYGGLGRDYMPQFDPARSTTKDVVRAAIIPRSREQGCALAKLMMDGVPTRPQAMVTHTWGNRFSDLVAAIVADALDDSCFAFARRLLDEKPERLHELLAWRGVLHKTYWVCAFSVNQHAAICGGGRDVDEVLQTPHPHCDCDHPKYWNDTPPASEDGRSIRCEMNKFDDMMKSLATSDKRFYQVIAMDRAFVTLSRCWCVAEIVEAHKSGMSQIIKIFDAATLRDNLQALDTLRVEDMAASRPEDVAEILSKIPDKDSFNERYRAIVQEGISRWSDMPFSDKIARAGRFWIHSMN